jgi:hypothetical protein
MSQHQVRRQRVYDLQLVATMLGNSVTTIYTYDTGDFQGFVGILALTP